MTEIKKLDLKSMNITEDKIQKLKQLFPEIFTEGSKIDFDKLKLSLGESVDTGKERYGMNWPGKADCFKIIQQPSIGTLVPVRKESVDFDTTENLFIEGDNLEVLKLLQKAYLGKIKMICIDPPYNTGNDFIYPDNYSESLDTYLRYTGQLDSEGRRYSTNTETDGRFHSKWLSMMYPRLFLARNLLREDGVIFISIDDNEVDNLKKICNEIFGEENFIETLIWKRRATAPNDRIIGKNHEYILVYAKLIENSTLNLQPRSIETDKMYINPDNDPRGTWKASDLSANGKGGRLVESCIFPIKNPYNNEEYWPPKNKCWLYNKDKIYSLLKENRIGFRENSGRPFLKRFLSDVRQGLTQPTIIDNGGFSQDSAKEIKLIFSNDVYEFPKPTKLLKKLLLIGNKNDIVLDFFAGSCTIAHAVLEQNKEDGGNRKFICVQLPEPCDEKSEAFKAGFKTIADIGKERIRRIIQKINKEMKDTKLPLFPENSPALDLGFKIFKLSSSNFKLWDTNASKEKEAIQNQLSLHIDHIDPNSSQEDILYEILLKSGFPLTTKIEQISLAGKTVFSIAEGAMLICLEKELTAEVMKAIAEKKPIRVVCLDAGFKGNDQLKTNAVQIMKSKKITDFRTV